MVVVTIQGHLATTIGTALPLVQSTLAGIVVQFRRRCDRLAYRRLALHHYAIRDGRLYFPAGLVPRVVAHLEARGHRVMVQEPVRWPQLARADHSLPGTLTPGYATQFLAALDGQPRGQIVVEQTRDIPLLIALLLRLYPQESVFVVARNRRAIRRLTAQLQRLASRYVTDDVERLWRHYPRVYVGSVSDFSLTNRDDWSVVVFADVESGLAKQTVEHVAWLPCLYFGFRQAQQRMDHLTNMTLESIVGPEIYWLRSIDHCTTVRVSMVGPFSSPPLADSTPLERKRTHVWRNDSRNRAIADIAHGLAGRDIAALRRHGIEPEHAPSLLDPAAPAPRLAILVESPEHGQRLRRLLPGWQILDATISLGPSDPDGLPLMPDHAIVTMLRASRTGLAADVLIRAEGTASSLGNDYGPYLAIHGQEMLVVDVRDDFDEQARRDNERRHREYRQRGWWIDGADDGARHQESSGPMQAKKARTAVHLDEGGHRDSESQTQPIRDGMEAEQVPPGRECRATRPIAPHLPAQAQKVRRTPMT